MRIRSKLLVNTIVAIVCLTLVGGIGLFFTNHVANLSMSLVEKEALPLFEINHLATDASEKWLRIIAHSGVSEDDMMQQLEQEMAQLDQEIAEHLQHIGNLYAEFGAKATKHVESLQNFTNQWQQFNQIAAQILEYSQDFSKEDALFLITDEGQAAYDKAIAILHELIERHQQDMESLRDNALQTQQQAFWAIITLTLLIGLFVLFFTNCFSRRLLTPLLLINDHLKELAQGKAVKENIEYHGKDEIAEIVQSSQQLRNSVNNTIEQAKAIAAGDYSKEVKLLSEKDQLGQALSEMVQRLRDITLISKGIAAGDYSNLIDTKGDKDILGNAINQMTAQLQKITDENQQSDWLKTGQTHLNDMMSGEQDINTLTKKIITFLTTYVEAEVGLFYQMQTESEKPYLQITASYAYPTINNRPDKYWIGEGLVGHAALKHKTLLRTHSPEEYAYIVQSNLATAIPHHVLIIPFLYEDAVKGVMEFGFSETPTRLQQDFLEQVKLSIGIAVNTTESRTKMQILLEQIQ